MPPQLSDDEMSGLDEVEKGGSSKRSTSAKVESEVEEELKVQSDNEDDEPAGEDQYAVEEIKAHSYDEATGELLYHVMWEDYPKKKDWTWEPEENLVSAPDPLNKYLAKIGGRESLRARIDNKDANKSTTNKGKKRGRASSTGTTQNSAKKGRKNGTHPADTTPPASAKDAAFQPPTGSWEKDVTLIDACEGNEGEVVVYLTWKNGQKTKHALKTVYQRCPQKMLEFYEKHLVFKKTDANDDEL